MKHTNTVRVKSSLAAIAFIVAVAVPVTHGAPIKYSASGNYTGLPGKSDAIRGVCFYHLQDGFGGTTSYKAAYFAFGIGKIEGDASISGNKLYLKIKKTENGYPLNITYLANGDINLPVSGLINWLKGTSALWTSSNYSDQLVTAQEAAKNEITKPKILDHTDYITSESFLSKEDMAPGSHKITVSVEIPDEDRRCAYTTEVSK